MIRCIRSHSRRQPLLFGLGRCRQYTLRSDVSELAASMTKAGVSRGYIVSDADGSPVASHAVFEPIADFLRADDVDYDRHEAIFFAVSPSTGHLMSAFLWKTKRGQGCGGIRLRGYDNIEEFVRDGLRLSLGMGRKSSLAGLWAGGGKGIIPAPAATAHPARRSLLEDYGVFLTSLRGCYVAAEDVGVTVQDLDIVFSKTRFATCISPQLGGSGNPSVPTAMGVYAAMESAARCKFGPDASLSGRTVAIQGLGSVGSALVGFLLAAGAGRVVGSDMSAATVDRLSAQYAGEPRVELRVEAPNAPVEHSILAEECDVFSPCGYGGILNENSVRFLRAKIVCGAANNQLLDPRSDYGMQSSGITYVPDFVCNRMGIVNCANEQYGSVGHLGSINDPAVARHLDDQWEHSIIRVTAAVINMADRSGTTTEQAARVLADQYSDEPHPLWGHRASSIIESLRVDGWAK